MCLIADSTLSGNSNSIYANPLLHSGCALSVGISTRFTFPNTLNISIRCATCTLRVSLPTCICNVSYIM